MRLFLAVEIPENIRQKIVETRIDDFIGKKVEKENLHLNIKFFGEVPVPDRIIQKISRTSFKPFTVKLTGYSAFPNTKFPRVLHIKSESPELMKLHSEIEKELKSFESRDYKPHITIMRVKEQERPTTLFEQEFQEEFEVKEIVLFKSDLKQFGPEYEEIYIHKAAIN